VERIDEKCNAADGIVNDANDAGSRRPPLSSNSGKKMSKLAIKKGDM
jgi:hypothetical protein